MYSIQPIDERYQDYLSDESRLTGHADGIAFPESGSDVREILMKSLPVTLSSGRTGITGGAVPLGGIVVSLEKMNRILEVGYDETKKEWYARLEPGVKIGDLQGFREKDLELFYPPDPTEKTAHIGGAVSCNASGARTFGFGPTRRYIRSLKVVLASGEIIDIPRGRFTADEAGIITLPLEKGPLSIPIPHYALPKTKNTAGYFTESGMDLIDLFIGSEGTLGVVVEIEIRLVPYPANILGAMIYFPSETDAVRFVRMARGETVDGYQVDDISLPQALEYFGPGAVSLLREKHNEEGPGGIIPPLPEFARSIVYYERLYSEEETGDRICSVLEQMLARSNSSLDNTWAEFDPGGIAKMHEFRHVVPESINSIIGRIKSDHPGITKLGTDFAVPNEHLETMLGLYRSRIGEAGLEYVIFGHIGDNHLHVNIIPRNGEEYRMGKDLYLELAREAVRLGGTVAAEHGIGKLKKNLLQLMIGVKGMEDMKKVKQTLDPKDLLNRGNLF